MKQIIKKIEYTELGKKHKPTEREKKARAFAYSLSLASLNDVGIGADSNLSDIRLIIGKIQHICLNETGYNIESSNWELVGSDYSGWKKNPYKNLPKTTKKKDSFFKRTELQNNNKILMKSAKKEMRK